MSLSYSQVKYRIADGSSTLKFTVDEITGWLTTRGTFTNNDGERFTVMVNTLTHTYAHNYMYVHF